MSNEDEDSENKEQMWVSVQDTTIFKNTTLIVVSGQDSSFSLAQMNYFIISFQIGVW